MGGPLGFGGGGTDLTPAVILAPTSGTRNVVQPTGDHISLHVKSQTGSVDALVVGGDGRVAVGTTTFVSGTPLTIIHSDSSFNSALCARNTNAGANARGALRVENDTGDYAIFAVASSGYVLSDLRGQGTFTLKRGFRIYTDADMSSGGTSNLKVITGGYNNNPMLVAFPAGVGIHGVTSLDGNSKLQVRTALSGGDYVTFRVFEEGTNAPRGIRVDWNEADASKLNRIEIMPIGSNTGPNRIQSKGGSSFGTARGLSLNYEGGIVVAGAYISLATTPFQVALSSAATNTISDIITLDHNTSGTPATGFGAAILYRLESSTTVDVPAGRISFAWENPTHASKHPEFRVSRFNSGGAEANYIRINSTSVVVGEGGKWGAGTGQIVYVGANAGGTNQGIRSVIIGYNTATSFNGDYSVVIGWGAGNSAATTYSENVLIGAQSGSSTTGGGNTVVGSHISTLDGLSSGTSNTLLGMGSRVSAGGAVARIAIGALAQSEQNNFARIGGASGTPDWSVDLGIDSTRGYYLGQPTVDGSWRIRLNGNNLVFERRESAAWVQKGSFAAWGGG